MKVTVLIDGEPMVIDTGVATITFGDSHPIILRQLGLEELAVELMRGSQIKLDLGRLTTRWNRNLFVRLNELEWPKKTGVLAYRALTNCGATIVADLLRITPPPEGRQGKFRYRTRDGKMLKLPQFGRGCYEVVAGILDELKVDKNCNLAGFPWPP